MAITEDTRSRAGAQPWSRPEKAVAALIALAFATVTAIVGALITEALSQLL
ncbi:hypothetical protein [Sinomonas atrocyanea]